MRTAVVGVFLLLLAQSASAAVTPCRQEPAPLLLPLSEFQAIAVEEARRRLSDAIADIKHYQEGLKVYRQCLERQSATMQSEAAEKGEDVDPAKLRRINNSWNATVDMEERIVADYEVLRGSLCSRGVPEYCE